MPPCVTNCHLINLWFPSICHSLVHQLGKHVYALLCFFWLLYSLNGSTRWTEAQSLLLWTIIPHWARWPTIILSPSFGCTFLIAATFWSNSSSDISINGVYYEIPSSSRHLYKMDRLIPKSVQKNHKLRRYSTSCYCRPARLPINHR